MRIFIVAFTVLFTQTLLAQMGPEQYYPIHYKFEKEDSTGLYALIYKEAYIKSSGLYFNLATGDYEMSKHNSAKAFQAYSRALQIANEKHIDSLCVLANYKMGYFHFFLDDYPVALTYFHKASLIINDKPKTYVQAKLCIHIGMVYGTLGSEKQAQKYYKIAAGYFRAKKNLKRLAATQNNIAISLTAQGDFKNAARYLDSCMAIRQAQADYYGIGQTYTNYGSLYYQMGEYKVALTNYEKGFENRIKSHAPEAGLIESQINIGKTWQKLGDKGKAVTWLEEGLGAAKKIQHYDLIRRATEILKDLYFENKEYDKAYKTQQLYYVMQDSLFGMDKKNAVENLALKNQFETKIKQDSIQNAEKRRADEVINSEKEKRSHIILYSLGGGMLFLLIFVFQLFRSNNSKKKTNAIIREQRDSLNQKQKEMIDSINYAKRIQDSLMPNEKNVERNLNRLKKKQ